MSPGDSAGPALHHQDEATSTTTTATLPGIQPAEQSTAGLSIVDSEPDYGARQAAVVAWLPVAPRAALERFALREFDRAEVGQLVVAMSLRDAELLAQREASYAISEAVDWADVATAPSHAELVRRRQVVL